LKNSPALVIKDGVVELQKESAFSEVIYTRTSGEIDFYSNGDKKTVTIGLSEDAPTNFKLIALVSRLDRHINGLTFSECLRVTDVQS
jgi:hypothetical protein